VTGIRCVVACSDAALAATLEASVAAASGLIAAGTVGVDRVRAGSIPPCEVVLLADSPGEPAAAVAADAARGCAGAAIVLVTAAPDIEAYRAALACGARGVLALPVSERVLREAVAGAVGAAPGESASATGAVVAIVAARGGAGATAVALALATHARGVVVDVAGGWACTAAVLGCRPERTLADLLEAGPAVAAGIDTVAVRQPPAPAVVAAPADPDMLAAAPPGWGAALVRDARASGVAVFDCGRAVPGPAREALVAADRVVAVCPPDAVSVAATRALITAAAGWGARGPVAIVVNRWSGRADLGVRQLSRAVGAPVAAVVRDDRRRMTAYDGGGLDVSLWAAGRPMAALRGLAAELAR
jgi:pilus assembly protein CpaE